MQLYPPEYYMNELEVKSSEFIIDILNQDSEIISQVLLEIQVEDGHKISAWYKNHKLIHIKDWFYDEIYDTCFKMIDSNLRIEHNFKIT